MPEASETLGVRVPGNVNYLAHVFTLQEQQVPEPVCKQAYSFESNPLRKHSLKFS